VASTWDFQLEHCQVLGECHCASAVCVCVCVRNHPCVHTGCLPGALELAPSPTYGF
jgi:hypothetical protein